MITSAAFKDKTYLVFGLGRTGLAAIKSLGKSGARVFAWDDKQENIEKAKEVADGMVQFVHPKDLKWQEIDEIVLSPGIPFLPGKEHQVVALARALNKPIVSDIDLLYQACPEATYIGITGTNGKSTTTALIGHILKENKKDVQVGGNIGIPVMELEIKGSEGIYVLELSSFQLDITKTARMNIVAFINISPDHIDRHGSFENYLSAKMKIFANQSMEDVAIISHDYPETKIIHSTMGNTVSFSTVDREADICTEGNNLTDRVSGFSGSLGNLPYLPGVHNLENVAAAYAAATSYGIAPKDAVAAIKTFKGLKHRIQTVLEIDDLKFVNDSKATNANSVEKALRCFDKVYWIVGGLPKSDGITPLIPEFKRIEHAYLIGQAQDEFAKVLIANDVKFDKCSTLDNALETIKKSGVKSGVVLFSPACASFDQFKDFEHRGDVYIKLVNEKFAK